MASLLPPPNLAMIVGKGLYSQLLSLSPWWPTFLSNGTLPWSWGAATLRPLSEPPTEHSLGRTEVKDLTPPTWGVQC